ncbi:MAG: hypothetical protein P0121_13150 [Nitrospira sp.]|nr:hypothetical protein [Nitrospira sp.]
MPRTATVEPRVDSSLTKTPLSRLASLAVDDRLTEIRFRDPKFVEEHVFFTVGGR